MEINTTKFLKRIAAGRNPRARSRSDEYVPHQEYDYEAAEADDAEYWYNKKPQEPYVHLPSRKGKRPGKVKEVWYDK